MLLVLTKLKLTTFAAGFARDVWLEAKTKNLVNATLGAKSKSIATMDASLWMGASHFNIPFAGSLHIALYGVLTHSANAFESRIFPLLRLSEMKKFAQIQNQKLLASEWARGTICQLHQALTTESIMPKPTTDSQRTSNKHAKMQLPDALADKELLDLDQGLTQSNTAPGSVTQEPTTGVINMAAFNRAFVLELAETVYKPGEKKGKHKKVGEAAIACPILADFGINAVIAKNDDGTEKYDYEYKDEEAEKAGKPKIVNALPIYEDVRYDWLQSAIKLAVTVKVRNKFQKGVLKQGMELPVDFEQLTAETARSGEALALRRDAKTDFEAYLLSLDKNAVVVTKLGELFWNSSKVLSTLPPDSKYLEAVTKYVGRWIEQLAADKAVRFAPKISELQDSINAATQSDEEEDLMEEGISQKKAA